MKRRACYQQHLNTVRPVLFEKHKDAALLSGFTDNYIKVELPFAVSTLNTIAPAFLCGLWPGGEAVQAQMRKEKVALPTPV